MKKVIILLLTGLLAVLLFGCGRSAEPVQAASAQATAVPAQQGLLCIASSTDGSNPYLFNNTLIAQDAGLLFASLLEITPEMELDYRLAQSVENSGTTVTVQLRSGCYFADGTEITAEDAAASLSAAIASPMYSARFTNLAAFEVQGSALVLTLYEPDSLFAYLLDLPVLKASETASPQPTASGRYTYGADGQSLVKNTRAAFAEDGPDTILLSEVSAYDEMVTGLAMGTVNFYIADDSGASTIASSENYYKTNDLVFLGINAYSDNALCSTAEGRSLLSQLLSRKELANKSYYARAYAATGTLNCFYPCAKGRQTVLSDAVTENLVSVMTQLGYTYNTETGFYQTARKKNAAVNILVYSSNTNKRYTATLIQQQWQSSGIEVTLTEVDDFNTYLQMVQSNQFELYIGEMKLYNNMDLSPFWSGSAHYGLAPSEGLLAAYATFRANAGTAGEFESAFAAEMPYIPILWRGGVSVTSRRVSGIETSLSNAFYSLAQMTVTG